MSWKNSPSHWASLAVAYSGNLMDERADQQSRRGWWIAAIATRLLELAFYGAFVLGYFWLIWHFLRVWILRQFETDRTLFALASLTLIAGQGVLLELVTSIVLRWFRAK